MENATVDNSTSIIAGVVCSGVIALVVALVIVIVIVIKKKKKKRYELHYYNFRTPQDLQTRKHL